MLLLDSECSPIYLKNHYPYDPTQYHAQKLVSSMVRHLLRFGRPNKILDLLLIIRKKICTNVELAPLRIRLLCLEHHD